jgi:ribosomal protein L37E
MEAIRGCARCGCREFDEIPCADCGLGKLAAARRESDAGQMLSRVLDLDFLTSRFRMGLEELSAEEMRGLMVLKEERERAVREAGK